MVTQTAPSTLGQRLRDLRVDRGLRRQEDLAAELGRLTAGFAQQDISRYEKGRSKPPAWKLVVLEDFYRLDPGTLVGRWVRDDPTIRSAILAHCADPASFRGNATDAQIIGIAPAGISAFEHAADAA